MAIETESTSYKSTDAVLLRDVAQSADARLQAQLTSALAADQRALVLAGFLVAAAVALVGGAVALRLSNPPQEYLSDVALSCAFGFLVGLALCVFAARPTDWGYPGTRPEAWIKDITAQKAEEDRLAELCADMQRKIGDNAELMKWDGRLIIAAASMAGLSLTLSGLALVCFFGAHP